MSIDFAWNLFKNTGNVDAFMIMKDLEKEPKKPINEEPKKEIDVKEEK